jgi:hypothetical protein
MPTILLINGLRFFFYSNENNEPIHIHIEKGDAEGKIWLEPKLLAAYFYNFTIREQNDILKIVELNSENFKSKWNEFFNK